MELISVKEFDVKNLKIKDPVKIKDSNNYISEIWYKSKGKPCRPVIKTPRLKVHFSAKTFNTSTSYSVSTYNRELDDDIDAYFTLVREIDKQLGKLFMKKRNDWNFLPIDRIRYHPSTKKNKSYPTPYMTLKMITTEGLANTTVNDMSGKKCESSEIKAGMFANQLVTPEFLYYSPSGVKSSWVAHQVVISQMERVFLDFCLLDDLREENSEQCVTSSNTSHNSHSLPPPPPPMFHYEAPILALNDRKEQQATKPGPGLSAIKVSDIQSMMTKLRKTFKECYVCKEKSNKLCDICDSSTCPEHVCECLS